MRDVVLTSTANGDVLAYDSASSKWKNNGTVARKNADNHFSSDQTFGNVLVGAIKPVEPTLSPWIDFSAGIDLLPIIRGDNSAEVILDLSLLTSLRLQSFPDKDGTFAMLDDIPPHTPITGATKTKITYDANGLVTAGADATPADVGAQPANSNLTTWAGITRASGIDTAIANGFGTTSTSFASGNKGVSTLSLTTPGVVFATPVTFTNTSGAWSGTMSLNNQSAWTIFGNGTSGSATPTFEAATGTGSPVRATSPVLVTPALGAATATSVNKVTITAPATGSTLTVADGKTLTASNSITLAGTDGKGINVGAATTGKILTGDGTNMVLSANTFPNASATSGKFIQSDGTNWIASTPAFPTTAGTSGKALISDGTNWISSTPTFPNASATSGKFIRSDGTNWIASTPTLPTAAGTAGKILRSDGTNYVESTPTFPNTGTLNKILVGDGTNYVESTPTFPNASATSGKFIRSDGTNWIASTPTLPTTAGASRKILVSDGTNFVSSTETYATPGASGQALVSDGTNWTSAAPTGYALNTNSLSTGSPAASSTYFLPSSQGSSPITNTATGIHSKFYIPKAGTIKTVVGTFTVAGTLASSGNSTLSVRLNNTTDSTVTSSLALTAVDNTFTATGLSIAVSQGDYIEFKWVTPAWVTAPTNTSFALTFYIE